MLLFDPDSVTLEEWKMFFRHVGRANMNFERSSLEVQNSVGIEWFKSNFKSACDFMTKELPE